MKVRPHASKRGKIRRGKGLNGSPRKRPQFPAKLVRLQLPPLVQLRPRNFYKFSIRIIFSIFLKQKFAISGFCRAEGEGDKRRELGIFTNAPIRCSSTEPLFLDKIVTKLHFVVIQKKRKAKEERLEAEESFYSLLRFLGKSGAPWPSNTSERPTLQFLNLVEYYKQINN